MAALLAVPTFTTTWAAVLAMWLMPAAWLLSTDVGRQALVDERVRIVEAFGGSIDDEAYARLQASPPWGVYLTTGGRYLVAPPVTALAALALVWLARLDGVTLGLAAAMAVSVHASVVLAVQQLVVVPVQYLRESITSATSLAVLLPVLGDDTVMARVLGATDVFGLWWIWLLGLGVAAATGRPAVRYVWRLLAVYLGLAVITAVVLFVAGGS
ncbi:MAG: hypothetical protein OEW19_21675 [Acidobacteriota bacterium]|nr:hypothetical protein [Acidobacteriota bacterium]